jgi:hypothetical protein
MAEGVGFEPTRAFALPVFKTGAINRSTTPPRELACDDHFGIAMTMSKRNAGSRDIAADLEGFDSGHRVTFR